MLNWIAAVVTVGGAAVALWLSPDSPRRWELFGFVLGTATGLLADHRWSRAAAVRSPRHRTLALTTGFAVLAVMIGLDLTVATGAVLLNGALTALASLWVLLAAPVLFDRLGWSAGNGLRAREDSRA